MKKYLLVFLSMLLVAGMSAFAYADDGGVDSVRSAAAGSKVIIGGDARVRGIWTDNFDMDNEPDADNRYWDQRVRLTITAQLPAGVELRTRLSTGDDAWDNAANTGGTLGVDYAYLHVPVGPVTIDAGRQKATFGNYFYQKDATRDRFKVTAGFGDTTVGAYTDKISDTFATITGDKNLDDADNYGLFVVQTVGNIEGGVLVEIFDDNTATDLDGTSGTGYVNVNVAGLDVKAELSMKSGDAYEVTDKDGNKNDPWGLVVGASKGLNALTVSGAIAYSKNGYVADNHFTPTVMIGTDNTAGIMDFGRNPDTATGGRQDSLLVLLGVDYKVTPELSVYGKAAYLGMDAYENNFATTKDSASATELDTGLEFQIAQNTTYNIDLGYMMPSDITTQDDNAMALSHAITIVF